MTNLEGRTALVTGASGALGGHFARVLARAGAAVVLAARRLDSLQALAGELRAGGANAVAVAMDVTDPESVRAGFEAAAALGPADILVNNSGIGVTAPALETTVEDWRRVIDTNLTGAFLVAQEGARRLVAAGLPGAIVNVGSILGIRAATQVPAYMASKAGLAHLTQALALEWARYRIRANALAPGYIETDLNRDIFATPAGQAMVKRVPQRRIGQLDDLTAPFLLLAGDGSRFMTGSVLVVDGGHSISAL